MLGMMVKAYLRDHGISQNEFARMCGINPATLSFKLNNENLREKDLQKFADILNVEFTIKPQNKNISG